MDVTKNMSGTKKPEAKITHITYVLKSAGRELVSGKSPDPEPLKANHTTELELELKVAFDLMLSLARDVASDWDIDYELVINFVANVPVTGDVTVPISNKGELKLPTFKDLYTLLNHSKGMISQIMQNPTEKNN
ncbi:hypothetical protein POM88_039857 [Heracleum sosnowskyi]|uniref:Water stress and hypersensitive response domain-containing protein n=1 Tax=Heracleum sosnowskyi TaxID=360622 RepID=A0AAD8HC50_9APIA|nr:hypothetical protein POM88_039857 [Heracleum sosnowskyi]